MKICSFPPSATEILFALGLDDSIVGVTFECNYPPAARTKRVVVNAKIPPGLSAAEIDREVASYVARGESIYRIDAEALREIQPDLIVTQDLCHVCAASSDDLAVILDTHLPRTKVISLNPHVLDDVWNDILLVGDATGRRPQGDALVSDIRARMDKLRRESARQPRLRVLFLEWLDPPYAAGHWVPEMVALAGGEDLLGVYAKPGFRVSWEQVLETQADVVIVSPCGYDESQAQAELQQFQFPKGWESLPAVQRGHVFPVDAQSYFARPGPRLAEGTELLSNLFSLLLTATPKT